MPKYYKLGKIPAKRHMQFEKQKGEGLFYEQLFGTFDFDGKAMLMYHLNRPTQVVQMLGCKDITPSIAQTNSLMMRKFNGFVAATTNDFLEIRLPMMVNSACTISLTASKKSFREYFYKNADSDELLFIHKGTGTLRTQLGNICFEYGDYLIIPRGMICQIDFDSTDNRIFYAESHPPIYTPKCYRNHFGQLLECSPYCERDNKLPNIIETYDQKGEFLIKIKKQNQRHQLVYQYHTFDVFGFDSYNYTWGFSNHNFEQITGNIHQPSPVHQTYHTDAFVVCSFCQRLYDYRPKAIPAPYNHSNINSDEVIYYVDGIL